MQTKSIKESVISKSVEPDLKSSDLSSDNNSQKRFDTSSESENDDSISDVLSSSVHNEKTPELNALYERSSDVKLKEQTIADSIVRQNISKVFLLVENNSIRKFTVSRVN